MWPSHPLAVSIHRDEVTDGHIRKSATEDVDATRLPFRQLVARVRQGLERGPIDVFEERPPAHAGLFHRAIIDGVDPVADGRVQIGQREKGAVPQRREDPPLRDLDTDLDVGFVLGPRDARGNHHGVIVARELGVVRLISGS